jgi:hypothetical protein
VENGIAHAAGSPQRFVRQITNIQTSILAAAGEKISKRAEMIGLDWQNYPLTLTLVKPDGSVLLATENSQDVMHLKGSNYDYYFLRSPSKGNWYVQVGTTSLAGSGERYSLITGLVKGAASASAA